MRNEQTPARFRPEFGNLEHIRLSNPAPEFTPLERDIFRRLGVESCPPEILRRLLQEPEPYAGYLVAIEPDGGGGYGVWVDVAPAVYLLGHGTPVARVSTTAETLTATLEGGYRYTFA